jgi:heme/copper-type cytochrome/quinol oxidase subunit 3
MATTQTALEVSTGHGHEPEPHRATQQSNAKLAIWMFLASDFLFFGAFISAFLLYRSRVTSGKTLFDVRDIPFTSATSFILLMSSLTMVLALAAIQRGDHRRMRIWLMATVLFGITFIGGQIYEFTAFAREGFTISGSLSGSTFFVLTGLHGVHVTIGIIWLLSLVGLSTQGRIGNTDRDHEKIEVAGLYWHFVDVIWIVIFTLVYLIPQGK